MQQYTQTTRYISISGKIVTITITHVFQDGKATSVATPQIKVERS